MVNLKKINLETQIKEFEKMCKQMEQRTDYQEDYSWRHNLRIDGIDEDPWEKWEVTEEKVKRLLRDKLEMDGIRFERVHRVGAPRSAAHSSSPSPQLPRSIVARFVSFKDRENTLVNAKKLKNTNIYINEDLCDASLQLRKDQLLQLREARAAGKVAYFRHTKLVTHERTRTRPGTSGDGVSRGGTGTVTSGGGTAATMTPAPPTTVPTTAPEPATPGTGGTQRTSTLRPSKDKKTRK